MKFGKIVCRAHAYQIELLLNVYQTARCRAFSRLRQRGTVATPSDLRPFMASRKARIRTIPRRRYPLHHPSIIVGSVAVSSTFSALPSPQCHTTWTDGGPHSQYDQSNTRSDSAHGHLLHIHAYPVRVFIRAPSSDITVFGPVDVLFRRPEKGSGRLLRSSEHRSRV